MFQNDQKNIPSAGKTDTIHLTCIRCPLGCAISVRLENLRAPENCGIPKERRLPGDCGILEVSGNGCPRGEEYARKEITDPVRTVTTTIPVTNGDVKRIPVKTREEIPKGRIFACVKALKGLTVEAPVQIGDVILPDVAGTGIPVVAAGNAAVKQLAGNAVREQHS
ncbi:hypothetical protein B5F07_11140 [Lachnoclostridium sp. An169]|uniref:DUF1667 domain-containing protein n=1 Tax=Lachnoclostridium sp. An169 TaxID=1965569 RepID=UPI000B3A48DF|nr:DUF1667 domain-containing protein [Lachnoclostridium sp. An169]OUP83231.1 hypothetical protein B5F07_11140 [Lachnoclostridium sp. An169]